MFWSTQILWLSIVWGNFLGFPTGFYPRVTPVPPEEIMPVFNRFHGTLGSCNETSLKTCFVSGQILVYTQQKLTRFWQSVF